VNGADPAHYLDGLKDPVGAINANAFNTKLTAAIIDRRADQDSPEVGVIARLRRVAQVDDPLFELIERSFNSYLSRSSG